jgi:hypothetical protein
MAMGYSAVALKKGGVGGDYQMHDSPSAKKAK